MSVGFKGFAKPTTLKEDTVKGQVDNLPDDEYVYWTGENYRARRGSGRFACLSQVKEKHQPITLRTYAQRCLKAAGDKGYDTGISVGGLYNHQGSKPTVFFYLVKNDKGDFVAKRDIPFPSSQVSEKPLKAGDVVIPAKKPAGKAVAKK